MEGREGGWEGKEQEGRRSEGKEEKLDRNHHGSMWRLLVLT